MPLLIDRFAKRGVWLSVIINPHDAKTTYTIRLTGKTTPNLSLRVALCPPPERGAYIVLLSG